jgi:hypothetical protein
VPPYCGVPRLSHQFPVAVVVVVAVVEVVTFEAVVVVLVVVVVFVVVVDAEVVDVVFVVQDANKSDATRTKVSVIQVIPLFIQTSFYFWNTTGKSTENLFAEYSEYIRIFTTLK